MSHLTSTTGGRPPRAAAPAEPKPPWEVSRRRGPLAGNRRPARNTSTSFPGEVVPARRRRARSRAFGRPAGRTGGRWPTSPDGLTLCFGLRRDRSADPPATASAEEAAAAERALAAVSATQRQLIGDDGSASAVAILPVGAVGRIGQDRRSERPRYECKRYEMFVEVDRSGCAEELFVHGFSCVLFWREALGKPIVKLEFEAVMLERQ